MTRQIGLRPLSDGITDDHSVVPTKLLYTVEEAAALLSLSRTSVFHLISEKKLAAVKIGGRRRVAHRALDDFVTSLRSAGGPDESPS